MEDTHKSEDRGSGPSGAFIWLVILTAIYAFAGGLWLGCRLLEPEVDETQSLAPERAGEVLDPLDSATPQENTPSPS